MRKLLAQITSILLATLILMSLCIPVLAEEPAQTATILFTHDLHSHLLPARDEDGGEYGGYARLMTVIQQQKEKNPDAILVDAGDFSMGSLFQTAYPTSAIELRMMGTMGFDATTFGNHEFDYLPSGLAAMLNTAAQYNTPVIVDANYLPPKEGTEGWSETAQTVWDAMENYGVKDYFLLERGGIYYAIFGLVGVNSDECAPNSGMVFEPIAEAAQRTVDLAVAECKTAYGKEPVVIALSHTGTEDGKGEDYAMAEAVQGIDLIISGHTHTTLAQPVQVGNTWIVSAGEYGRYLGVAQMAQNPDGSAVLTDYDLIPVDETVPEEPEIAALVEAFKKDVETNYLADYGMTFDQILTSNPYTFDNVDAVYSYAHESTLGNVFSDAYRKAASEALRHNVDVALTASGVIRESIPVGDVSVSDIFNAASLGVGTEGELVEVWLTGKDLKTALEVDASVYPLMNSAQLFYSGVEYSFNTNRMIFNKVDYAMLRRDDGSLEPIQDDQLYCITCGMYMAQMLGNVKKTSMGLLSLTPRDAGGNPLDTSRLAEHVIRQSNGMPVKEWYAIASYLQSMGEEMDPQYAQTDGRKVVYSSWNPVKLLSNANVYTWIVLLVLVVLVLAAVLIVCKIRNRKNRSKNR